MFSSSLKCSSRGISHALAVIFVKERHSRELRVLSRGLIPDDAGQMFGTAGGQGGGGQAPGQTSTKEHNPHQDGILRYQGYLNYTEKQK